MLYGGAVAPVPVFFDCESFLICPAYLRRAVLSCWLATLVFPVWADDSSSVPAGAVPEVAVQATPPARPARHWMYELDPYYSSLAWEIPLTDVPLEDGDQLSETEVYRRLGRQSLSPQIVLFEASVYPLPLLGSWLKSASPETYRQFDAGSIGHNSFNVIDAVTAGFQEPWAVSMFVGSAMNFQKQGDMSPNNRGYMGYLLSYGAQHIWHNQLIQDRWWELEWKLKGEQRKGLDLLSWSFRLGLKEHGNDDIADLLYVALRRSSLKFDAPLLDWLNNTNVEWRTEFDRRNMNFLRQEVSLGYKLPFKAWGVAVGLDVGLIYEESAKYRGTLADPAANHYTLILRPRLDF